MKLLILMSLLLSVSISANASVPSGLKPLPLVTITNDKDSGTVQVSVLLDKNDKILGLYSKGEEAKTIWFKDVEKPAGVPLVESQGYTVISLQGSLSRERQEGRITARYLVNAMFGRAQACQFDLKASKDGWYIKNIYTGRPVKSIHVTTSSVGVNQIQGLCTGVQ